MPNRTFIVLGNDRYLTRTLREALPDDRVVQTDCLDLLPPLKKTDNAHVLVGNGTIRSCCMKRLQDWTTDALEEGAETPPSVPAGDSRARTHSASDAWAERARLVSAEGACAKVRAFIAAAREHDHEWFTVFEAADSLGISVRQLRRIVEHDIGYSPHVLLHLIRIESVARQIEQTGLPLKEVAKAHQFADPSSMNRQFKRFVGITPGQFRRRRSAANSQMEQPGLFARDH